MLKIYYTIWVDGLQKLKSIPQNKGMWKFYGMTFISMAMALNLIVVMTILQNHVLYNDFYDINVNIFDNNSVNALISFLILFLFPPLLVNYLLIFRKSRYKDLFKRYKTFNGKLCVSYLMFSFCLPIILVILGKALMSK